MLDGRTTNTRAVSGVEFRARASGVNPFDMSSEISLEVHDNWAVLTCVGDLDLNHADELRRTFGSASRTGADTIVIDLAGTDLVDSTTLGVLLHANNACKEIGSTLVIAGAPRTVARSIALTGLDRVLRQSPDVASALTVRRRDAAAEQAARSVS